MEELRDIVDEMAELAKSAPPFTPVPFRDPNNRWLARSAIQKAMRRGRLDEALAVAAPLWDHDPSQIWRTLATVVIEDIGIGDLDLVAYSCVTTLKSVRDQVGAERLFAAMVQRACESPKSQACCELDLGTAKDPKLESTWKNWEAMSEADLLGVMLDPSVQCSHVAAVLLRSRLRHQGPDALVPALTAIRDGLPDDTQRRAAMLSFERTVDTMNVAMFPVLRLLNQQPGPNCGACPVPEEFPPEVMINSVSSAAYDMHTLQGKRAIKAYWRWLCGDSTKHWQWAKEIPEEYAGRAIGSLIFMVEGGLLDSRIRSPFLNGLQDYQQSNFAIGYGVPETLIEYRGLHQMKVDVRETIWRLNELRQWSAKL